MKKTVSFVLSLLFVALFLAALPIDGEEEIYGDVIRLHVLAASDTAEDQERKLAVRDAILSTYGERLGSATSLAEAGSMLTPAFLSEMKKTATEVLSAKGCDMPVEVTFTEESYPTREYPTFSLPAGTYLSLRVIIGEGEGQNWWCVLYPPLCNAGAMDEVPIGISDAEYRLISRSGWKVRFRTLELLRSIFD
jgi:stage II sporulation protein R